MPLYEFVCHDCTSHFERLMSFAQEASPVCPVCQSLHTVRQVSIPSIHFRGSGFYQTDARASADKKEEKNKDTDGGKESQDQEVERKSTTSPHQAEETKSSKPDKVAVETSASQDRKTQDSRD